MPIAGRMEINLKKAGETDAVAGWKSKITAAGACLLLTIAVLFLAKAEAQAGPGTNTVSPSKSLVVIVENPGATTNYVPSSEQIRRMLDAAIFSLARTNNLRDAWLSFVSTNDVVGLKVFSEPGQNSGTRPEVVEAVVQDLLDAGLPPKNIVIWDSHSYDLRIAGFYDLQRKYGITVAGSTEAGYDDKVFYDSPLLGTLSYLDSEFGKTGAGTGRRSFVSKLVTKDLTKIINITPLLHHNSVGVTGNLYSLAMSSVDNTARFDSSPETLARVVPEIWALPVKGAEDRYRDHVALNIVDALFCQYEGQHKGFMHYSTVLNQLRLSRDAVALDVLSLEEITRQRKLAGAPVSTNTTEMFINASLLELGTGESSQIKVEHLKN